MEDDCRLSLCLKQWEGCYTLGVYEPNEYTFANEYSFETEHSFQTHPLYLFALVTPKHTFRVYEQTKYSFKVSFDP